MNYWDRKGEIAAVGQVLDAKRAVRHGDVLLRLAAQRRRIEWILDDSALLLVPRPSNIEVSELRQKGNDYSVGKDDRVTIDTAKQAFSDIIRGRKLATKESISSDALVGTEEQWHIDKAIAIRLLINVSREPIKLLVATEWDPLPDDEDFDRIDEHDFHPTAYDEISYAPGEGVIVDNYCKISEQVPHTGVAAYNKVSMRLFAYGRFSQVS